MAKNNNLSRRALFGAGITAAALSGLATPADAADPTKAKADTNLRPDGTYETVPLAMDA